jgi:two-component system, OmpR family, KDP operon response regulator KdpE
MTQQKRVLLVDDEVSIQRSLSSLLRSRGYAVDVAPSGESALKAISDRPPDLVLLDLGLPLLDGGEVCRRVRDVSPVPIIVLTARNNETEKVSLLDIGADDYVTKPFSPAELLARIRVALRRNTAADEIISGQMQAGAFTVDYDRRRVQRGSQEIRLTPKEFQLLSLFAQNPDRALTHREILRHIWGANAIDQPEHLWVLISQLRKKIEPDPSKPRYLVSEPWYGYRFVSEGQ